MNTAQSPSSDLAAGEQIVASSTANVRSPVLVTGTPAPCYGDTVVTTIPQGKTATVISDPNNGTAYNGHYWWHVSYGGYDGWSAEDLFQTVATPALTISSVTPTALQVLSPGQSMKYTVTVQDGSGNPVDGATVNISDDVQGTCPSPLPTTNSSGQATYTTTVPSGEASGTYDIVFSASDNGYTDSASVTRQVEVPAAGITDQQKENAILAMVNDHRGALPAEFVLAEIFQEGGQGAFYVDGSNYNSFYNASDAPWAQPTNGDGIMQVTSASGYHQLSGTYTNDQTGYDHAISDGCAYLDANFSQYGTVWQTASTITPDRIAYIFISGEMKVLATT